MPVIAVRRFRLPSPGESTMSSFALYLIGMIVVIGGLAYVAFLLHVPSQWIVAGAVVLLGLGIVGAVTHTRRRDPPES
jgi:protein-S-isoprenylcysteine O-methyltransferase Ste14